MRGGDTEDGIVELWLSGRRPERRSLCRSGSRDKHAKFDLG